MMRLLGLPAAVLAELTAAEQRARDRDRAEAAVSLTASFICIVSGSSRLRVADQRVAAAMALEDQLLAIERSPLDVLVEIGGSGSGAGDAKAGTVSLEHQARSSASTAVFPYVCGGSDDRCCMQAALTEAVTHARNWLERDEGQVCHFQNRSCARYFVPLCW
jgi:hypothetical protein